MLVCLDCFYLNLLIINRTLIISKKYIMTATAATTHPPVPAVLRPRAPRPHSSACACTKSAPWRTRRQHVRKCPTRWSRRRGGWREDGALRRNRFTQKFRFQHRGGLYYRVGLLPCAFLSALLYLWLKLARKQYQAGAWHADGTGAGEGNMDKEWAGVSLAIEHMFMDLLKFFF